MKPTYTDITTEFASSFIKAEFTDGVILLIPKDPANSDYQAYLRWLENPDADESGTLTNQGGN